MSDTLKSEKQTRDKLQHERDKLVSEKYSADQQIKVQLTAFVFL